MLGHPSLRETTAVSSPPPRVHSITLLPFDVWHEIFIQLDSHDDHETLVSATCIDRHVQSAAEAALHYSVAITNWRHVAAFAKCRPAARWTRHLSFSFPDRYDNEWFCKGVLPAYMLLAHLSTAQPRLFSLRVRSGLLCSLSQVHASFEDLHTSSQNGRRGPKSQVLPALQMVKNIAIIFEAWMGIPGLSTDHLEALLHCCRTYDRTLTAIQLENVPSGSGCLFSIVYTFLKERLVDFKVSLGAAQPYDELKREHLIDVLQLQGNVHLPMLRTLTLDETKRSYEIVPDVNGRQDDLTALEKICPNLRKVSWIEAQDLEYDRYTVISLTREDDVLLAKNSEHLRQLSFQSRVEDQLHWYLLW